jgi:fimbrial chaperone protein
MKGLALIVAGLAWTASAFGGSFGVSPIRVDLDRQTKSALVTVTNDDDRPLAFQVRAMAWTQESAGEDRYADTADLVFFPQQLRIAPGESRVVRVGYRVPAVQAERAYRLFIEELADPARALTQTGVAITLRFGVPVFLRPAAERAAGEVDLSDEAAGAVARLRNTGNVHFRIAAVRYAALGADGEVLLERSLDGWYLLSGAERSYRLALPGEVCRKTRLLRVDAVAEKLSLRAEHALGPQACR